MQRWKNFEKYPRTCLYFSIFWLLFVNGIAFLWHLGSTGLVDETEPLFAEAARQMVVTGDWITPYFNGATRFDKPPLVYWLMAIAYRAIGVNEWAVRLPSALSAIALTCFGFFTLLRFGYPQPGALSTDKPQTPFPPKSLWLSAWIGSTLMAFNLQTLVWAHTGVSDMLLSACMGCALFCFFWGYGASAGAAVEVSRDSADREMGGKGAIFPNRWYLAFYVFIALAILTKGPVGIAIPGLVIFAFLWYVGRLKEVLREMGVLVGGILVSAIALPWFVLVIQRNGEAYIDSFFGYHNVERFTHVVNGHAAPWYFYFLVVLVGFLPWSVYLPVAIARLRIPARSRWQAQPRNSHLGIFALSWFAVIFLFFTIAVTKLPSYTLPLIPAAAILVSLFWSQKLSDSEPVKENKQKSWGFFLSAAINALILLVLAIASWFSPRLIGYDAAAPNIGELFGQTGLSVRSAIVWGMASGAIALLLWKTSTRRWILPVNLIAFALFLLFVLTPANFFIDRVRQQPIRELAAIAAQSQQPGENLLMTGFKKPTFVFYSQRPVQFFYGKEDTMSYARETAATASPTLLLLSQSTAFSNTFGLQPNQYQIVGQRGIYQLVRIDRATLGNSKS
ncbi:glycosyltransferase family 39 protein [Oscillatoria sp. FACHB-1406]|uniref:ArnT family glycosyltransferase n=1 Tax=Oscillatoria sp. FACHB-1406 TaxID=2692846 RepID=UPI001689A00E|nr:glycosyltransferase family 39 protein [Oscillatoria sp. FACHB-1406]MBD2578698.1 glycosyltransferase family 39 protein [Oscillatoria sp. FACHB-1406]